MQSNKKNTPMTKLVFEIFDNNFCQFASNKNMIKNAFKDKYIIWPRFSPKYPKKQGQRIVNIMKKTVNFEELLFFIL